MKLIITRKSEFTKNRNNRFLIYLLFIVLFHFPITGFSQQFQFKFVDTPISLALLEIANKMDVKIAFDAGELRNTKVTKTILHNNAEEIILSVLAKTNYSVDFRHNTYLVYKTEQNIIVKEKQDITFSGIIFDNETGERLPYATILIWDNNFSISTTVDGTFSTQLPDSATSFIQIKYLGYQTLDTIIHTANAVRFLELGLNKKTRTLNTVEIIGEKIEMVDISREAGHFTFNPSRFSDLPNYGETDVFRALQMLPGISSIENSSQLNIRGGSADQNLVLFDGFTLYNLDHFFGVFSALNANVIKNIQVYRGGFDSRYGERVSGIVDITGKTGNQNKTEVYGGVNLMSANITAEIPISKKFTLVAAGRRAYTDIYSTWLADALLADKIGQSRRFKRADNVIEPEFYFSDFNLKLTYSPNQKENISFSSYGAKDYLNSTNIVEKEFFTTNTEDINQWGNYGFGLSWKKQRSTKYFTNIQLGHSGYFNEYFSETTFSGDFHPNNLQNNEENRTTNEENRLSDYFVTFQNRYSLDSKNEFEFGITAKYNEFTFYKDASRDIVYNNLKSSAFLYSLFFQDKINLKNNFTIKPGFRLNYFEGTGKIYFEPRLSASYKLGNNVVLKMATGRYFQYLNKLATEQNYGYNRDFWVLADDKRHPVVSSNHFIVGASYETKKWFFDVETYYKLVDGLQEYLFIQNPDHEPGKPPVNQPKPILSQFIYGDGEAYGIDFLAKYESVDFTSWLAYSISKSTRSFAKINSGENIPAQYDQTHEVKWTNIYTYKKWNFSTLTIFTTGHPYIEFTEKDDDFNATRTYNRLPDYFRIDFSLNYNFNIKSVNIKPGLSILNALNTENYLDIYTRNFDFEGTPVNETTLVKAQDLTFNFFVNFRF
ncbi:MAG: TonB-dependent receptor plug domain-containing protein [Draconibacterium sp.]|nr:TonB-dependent receptor plug domain-containing protein [Draconibacterium sp.]